MAGEADAVNERLAGLVNLLQVVGIDGVNSNALTKTQQQQHNGGRSSSSGGAENQILALIQKLQQAQADSPEILAALQSPELRALATLAAAQSAVAAAPKKSSPALDDVMDDDDDNYPKIGPGYSDDISVVSDMTTPTVMTKQHVADEEYYHEVNGGPGSLPPAHIGMGVPANKNAQQPARPTNIFAGAPGHGHPPARGGKPNHLAGGGKTKNLVGQVRPATARNSIAKSGGAAAQRRLNYQQAMQKLQTSSADGIGGSAVASVGATASSRGPTTSSDAHGHGDSSGAAAATSHGGGPEKSYMDNFSPKRPKEFFTPTSPTPSQNPMEFPSLVGQTPGSVGSGDSTKKKKAKSKSLLSRKGKKDKSLAAQEESDFDFEGTDPIRAPPTPTGSLGGGGGKKKVSAGSNRTATTTASSTDVDWGVTEPNGWPSFDNGNKSGGSSDFGFGDSDDFFPTDAFSSSNNDNGFQSAPSSSSQQPPPTSWSRKPQKAPHDDDHRPTSASSSSRKVSKVKKEKKDGDPKRDKDKSEKRKKSRRASLSM